MNDMTDNDPIQIAPSEIWVAELSMSHDGMYAIRKGAENNRYRELIARAASYEIAAEIARSHNATIGASA